MTDSAANNYDAEATADDGSAPYDFTVQVDMSEVLPFLPNGHIAGAFQGWAASTPLADVGNGIWSGKR